MAVKLNHEIHQIRVKEPPPKLGLFATNSEIQLIGFFHGYLHFLQFECAVI